MSKRSSSQNFRTEAVDHDCPVPIKKPRDDASSTSRNDEIITPVNVDSTEYNMEHSFRGHAVIFHQQDYKRCPCKCSNIEVRRLSKTLTNLGFEVTAHENLSLCMIKRELKLLAEDTDHTSADCVVVVMLAKGNANNLLCGKTDAFSIEELWMPFCATKCPSLAGKPKIFFIEACQEECLQQEMILRSRIRSQLDSSIENCYIIPDCADFLIVYNILMEGSAQSQRCSCFIEALCQKLERLSPDMDLLKIVTHLTNQVALDFSSDVNDPCDVTPERLWQNGVPHINSTLTRDVYFYPKINK